MVQWCSLENLSGNYRRGGSECDAKRLYNLVIPPPLVPALSVVNKSLGIGQCYFSAHTTAASYWPGFKHFFPTMVN